MNTKISVMFSMTAIVAAVLLFAAGPLVTTHQAYAWGGGLGWRRAGVAAAGVAAAGVAAGGCGGWAGGGRAGAAGWGW